MAMRNLKLLVITVLLLLCGCSFSFAQEDDGALIVEVVNADGKAIQNACVTFVPKSGDILFEKADRRGRVRVRRLHRGKYRVVVKVDGYEAQKKEVTVASANDKVAFVMRPRDHR